MKEPINLAGLAFDEPCPHCDASGVQYSEAWREWNEQHPKPPAYNGPQDRAALEAYDESMPNEPEENPCIECEGVGLRPTEVGLAILRLVRRYHG